MPFNQLQSPENIIKAEVLLVALVKGLGLDAAGKPPLPTGHTISLQVGQLLCSAVWDAATRVWRTSSILYHGSSSGAAGLGTDQSRPLLCLLEPPELRVTPPWPGADQSTGNPLTMATVKLLLQHVPLLAFVEQGGVSAGLPSSAMDAALQQQQQLLQRTGSAAADPSNQAGSSSRSLSETGAPAAREGSTGSSTATGGSSTHSGVPVPSSEGASEASRTAQPTTNGNTLAPAATGKQGAAQSQWRLRISYAGRELPSGVINNVAFVTEDHFPVQVLVVELEVNMLPLCYMVVPGHTQPADHVTVMLSLELLMQEVAVAQLRLPAMVMGLPRDGMPQTRAATSLYAGGAGSVGTGSGAGGGGFTPQAGASFDPPATNHFAGDGQHHRRRLMGMPLPGQEHVSQHSAGSSTTHHSYVTVVSNPSDALPSPVMAPEFASARSSAPAAVNRMAHDAAATATASNLNVQHGLILLQSISTRDDTSSAMNSRAATFPTTMQSGTTTTHMAHLHAHQWPTEEGARPVGERQEEVLDGYFEDVHTDSGRAGTAQHTGAASAGVAALQREASQKRSSIMQAGLGQSHSSIHSRACAGESGNHLDSQSSSHHSASNKQVPVVSAVAAPDLAINTHQLLLGSSSPNTSPDLAPLPDSTSTSPSPSPEPSAYPHPQHLPGSCSNSISALSVHGSGSAALAARDPHRKNAPRTRFKNDGLGPSNLGRSPRSMQQESNCSITAGQSAPSAGAEPSTSTQAHCEPHMAPNAAVPLSAEPSETLQPANTTRAVLTSPFAIPQPELAARRASPSHAAVSGPHALASDGDMHEVLRHQQPRGTQQQHLRVAQLSQSPSKAFSHRLGSPFESGDVCSEYQSATSSLAGRSQ